MQAGEEVDVKDLEDEEYVGDDEDDEDGEDGEDEEDDEDAGDEEDDEEGGDGGDRKDRPPGDPVVAATTVNATKLPITVQSVNGRDGSSNQSKEIDFVLEHFYPETKSNTDPKGKYAFGRLYFEEHNEVLPENKQNGPENNTSKVKFSPYIKIDVKSDLEEELKKTASKVWNLMEDHWKVPVPKLIISVTGGAQAFRMNKKLRENFKSGLVQAASDADAWIITGGTNSGIMKIVGDAVLKHKTKEMVVLGIALWGVLAKSQRNKLENKNINENFRDKSEDTSAQLKAVPRGTKEPNVALDPNHTHFIIVDSGKKNVFGGEISFRSALENHISTNPDVLANRLCVPIVMLVLEGGIGTLGTAAGAIIKGTPVVVIAGSGRAADFLVYAENLLKQQHKNIDNATRDESGTNIFNSESVRKLESEAKNLNIGGTALKKQDKDWWNKKDGTGTVNREKCLGYLKDIFDSKRKHLLTIFHEQDIDSGRGVSKAIIDAIFNANNDSAADSTNKFEKLLKLTLSYNAIEKAKEIIFIPNNHTQMEEHVEIMKTELFTALKENKHEFVRMILDTGVIPLKKFLTIGKLVELYEIQNHDKKQLILRSHIVPEPSLDLLRRIIRDEGKSRLLCLPGRKIKKHSEKTDEYYFKKVRRVINRLAHQLLYKDVIDKHSKDEDFENPKRELFFWSLLLNRKEMAMVFWEAGNDNIAAALTANRLLTELANRAKDKDERDLYQDVSKSAEEFEKLAVGVMSACYSKNKEKARILTARELVHWGIKDVLVLANAAKQMSFMESACIQAQLTTRWYGKTAFSSKRKWKIMQIFFCLLCPLLGVFWRKKDDKHASEHPNITKWHKFVNFFRHVYEFLDAPVVKFCYNMISYVVFLGLYSYFLMCDLYPRTVQHPGICEILVWVWVFSFIIEEIRQVVTSKAFTAYHKLRNYWSSKWNKFDVFVAISFIISIILRWTLPDDSSFEWARMFYAGTLAFYFLRFLQIFYVFEHIGPLVIIIQYMLVDALFFLLLLAVFLFAFGITAQALLYPNSEPSWEVLKNVVFHPYFNIFGTNNLDELQGCVSECSNNATFYYSDACTTSARCPRKSWLVMVAFAAYIILINILLVNLLIAQFGYTFNRFQPVSEKVWRFFRYELIFEYVDKPVLAPPLIIISIVGIMFRAIYKHPNETEPEKTTKQQQKELKLFEKARTEEYLHALEKEKAAKEREQKRLEKKAEKDRTNRRQEERMRDPENLQSKLLELREQINHTLKDL